MRLYTAFICTDLQTKWAVIEASPPMLGKYITEVDRVRFTRPNMTVIAIITDNRITYNDAKNLLASAFDNPQDWLRVDLSRAAHRGG